MSDAPVLSIEISNADLIRLASPRILSQYPMIGAVETWVIDVVKFRGGIRFDLIGPASGENRQ
jgi:hypothetical protein